MSIETDKIEIERLKIDNDKLKLNLRIVIRRLKDLQRFDITGGLDYGHTPAIDCEIDKFGDWVSYHELESIIKDSDTLNDL